MKKYIFIIDLLFSLKATGQELFVFSEPASNMPAHSISLKLTDHFVTNDNIYNRFSHRIMPQVMFGISKKLMLHFGGTIANMHTPDIRYESVNFYAKYRFLSKDEIHRHFRMAVFADASATRAPFHYDEITLMGDKNGVEAGLIATQLWHKLAVSGTLSHTQVLDDSRKNGVIYVPSRNYKSVNYALSAGYLLLPKNYVDYNQLNINIYTELLGQKILDRNRYYLDIAPALQFIIKSNSKLNIGGRFQVNGNMGRMANNSWQISFERTFLHALKRKSPGNR
jgi:hypothetical protein